ncbi:hypothetical protein IIB79_09595 [candidate division KSB1 bacterium]|nr:hypothetical protein [candidate division KSB1 bacterium]
MRYNNSILVAVFIALFFNCSGIPELQLSNSEPLTDVLTLELSFGEEGLPDEYLLVYPSSISPGDNGELYVNDERRIKVYDNNGEPKVILGGPGEGPGEFRSTFRTYVSSEGNLATPYTGNLQVVNIFSKDHTFIKVIDFRNALKSSGLFQPDRPRSIWIEFCAYYNANTVLAVLWGNDPLLVEGDEIRRIRHICLLNNDGNLLTSIYKNDPDAEAIMLGVAPHIAEEAGQLSIASLSQNRIVYTDPQIHKVFENGQWYYILNVFDVYTNEESELRFPYLRVAVPDSIVNPPKSSYDSLRPERRDLILQLSESVLDEFDRDKKNALQKLQYYGPVRMLKTDGPYVFVYTWEYKEGKGWKTDVINADTGEFLSAVYLPFDYYMNIKDGFAYTIATASSGFRIVEKYKISPVVYGKK